MKWSSEAPTLTTSVLIVTIMHLSLSFAGYLKYPFDTDFNVKTARYTWNDISTFSMNVINYDARSFDSLELCIYFRSPDGLEKDLGARLDLCIEYMADGYQRIPDSTYRYNLFKSISSQYPEKIENTFRISDSTHAYSLRFPLNGTIMKSQSRIRIDVQFVRREPVLGKDLLNEPSAHQISKIDWTFGPHSRADGDLIDFDGVDSVAKDDIDINMWGLQTNYYVTIHRKDQLLWGIPPKWQSFYNKEKFILTDTRPVQDPMPYAPIATPFNEFEDQLIRDSVNLHISSLRVNQAGYRPGDKKYFYFIASAPSTFTVLNTASGASTGSGTLKSTGLSSSGQLKIKASNNGLLVSSGDTKYMLQSTTKSGTVYEGELPDLPEGKYRVVAGGDTSAPFIIEHDVYNMIKDALLKFYGVNRCGDSKSWFHPPCHLQDAVTGGWHDCGDHLKEGATMSYTAAVLGLAAAAFSEVDQDVYNADQSKTVITDGIPDILYEAKHGADFILRSYDLAGGDVSKMITSIGGFSEDHNWYGPPEFQDQISASRGGPPRKARNEATTDYLSKYAANLAFVSKLFKSYDSQYADRCIKAAKVIYEFTKIKLDKTNTPTYTGSTSVTDDIAFGCLALLWATEERKYLDDLCFDKTIGTKASSTSEKLFTGGWFTADDPVFFHNTANTDWASVHTHVLWGFFKLVLNNEPLCEKLGLTKPERLSLLEKTAYNMVANTSSIGNGTHTISLPEGITWIPSVIKYDQPWFNMHTQMEWMWNKYQAANITDLFYCYDVTKALSGLTLPNTSSTVDWKSSDLKTIIIRMLDYMLGVNPWDISMIYGIGSKNYNHPLHRASNPELRNCTVDYQYRHLVGALQGGFEPSTYLYTESASDYYHSEVGIEGTTNIIMPVLGLCVADRKVSNRYSLSQHALCLPVIDVIQKRTEGILLIRSPKPLRSAKLYSISGRLVAQQMAKTNHPLTIILQHNTGSGMYLLQVESIDGTRAIRTISCTH